MTVDLDLDVGVETARDGVRPARVHDAEVARPGCTASEVVKALVERAQRRRLEVDDLDRCVLAFRDGHQTAALSHA